MPDRAPMPIVHTATCGCGVQDGFAREGQDAAAQTESAADVQAASVASGVTEAAPGSTNARYAVAVDADRKQRNIKRLRRIEGQVRGLQGMIEDDRYCADILMQLSSVQQALRAVSRELMRNHLKHCATRAIRSGDATAEPMYDELVDLIYKHSR